MMGPGDGYPGHINPHHSGLHNSFPMDLQIHQGFPYYRQSFDPSGRFPQATQAMPPVLELRKEKSRDAARSRRGKENYEFYELAKMLPLPAAITSQLDKASIIRLTISYLRIKDFSAHGDPPWLRDNPNLNKKGNSIRGGNGSPNPTLDLFEQHQGTHILQSLDGFAFALAADGRFLYISETVSIYLGLSQVEMTGSSVFDYIHQNDQAELAEQLGLGLSHGPGANVPSPVCSEDGSSDPATNNPDVSSIMSITSNSGYKGLDRAFCIRMKSTLTKRGCHFKSSGYRVVLILCRLRAQYSFSHKRSVPPPLLGMVALAIALPPPSVHEIRLESHMFVTKVTFDLRIIHCEPRVCELLDYKTEELTGLSLYSLCHAADVHKLRKCHVDLLDKGQVMSEYYRVLNKNGGYLWIQTCATVVSSSKNSDDQIIICVNYVISTSQDEFSRVVMDNCQLEQELQPIVKREVLLDDPDKMSPGHEITDGSVRSRDSSIWASSSRSPCTRVIPSREESPITEPIIEKKTKGGKSRLNGESSALALDSRPFTPISPHESREVRTPHSLVTEPSSAIIFSPTKIQGGTRGRKRKSEKLSSDAAESSDTIIGLPKSASKITQDTRAKNYSMADADSTGRWRKSGSGPEASVTASSVNDLENLMSKHLPVRETGHLPSNLTSATDFSTESLLRQTGLRGDPSSQWFGSSSQSAPGLPVSALLQRICASRESVIRANVQAAAAAAVQAGRSGYYSDISTVASALPTPPDPDVHNDSSERSETDDEGIERDSGESDEDGSRFSFNSIIEICTKRLGSSGNVGSTSTADSHYKAVCRALVAEALELSTFLKKVSEGTHQIRTPASFGGPYKGGNHLNTEPEPELNRLNFTDWARLWVQVIQQLRQGVRLKKVDFGPRCPPIEYELTPYEYLMDDIRARRFELKKVMQDGALPHRIKKDAHAIIIEFIRSRPPLKKATDRVLAPAPKVQEGPIELLMKSIREEHKLKPARPVPLSRKDSSRSRSRRSNSSDMTESHSVNNNKSSSQSPSSEINHPPSNQRRLIKADLDVLYSLNTKDEDDEDDESFLPDSAKECFYGHICPEGTQSTPVTPSRKLNGIANGENGWMDVRRRHSVCNPTAQDDHAATVVTFPFEYTNSSSIFKTLSYPRASPILNRRRAKLSHSESKSSLQEEFFQSNHWQTAIECLSLNLEEVVHIRNVLTKAELESLPMDCSLKEDVEKGKVCFLCLKTRFSLLLGPWGNTCKLCKRTVCAKCCSKMRIPTDHFAQVPVSTLSPNISPREEEKELPGSKSLTITPTKKDNLTPPVNSASNLTGRKNSVGSAPTSPSMSRKSGVADTDSESGGQRSISPVVLDEEEMDTFGIEQSHGPRSLPSVVSISRGLMAFKRRNFGRGQDDKTDKLKGSLMVVCHDCKAMVLQIIRSSRVSKLGVIGIT